MQGREGAGPGISQPRSDGGRRFHPGPRRGPGRECCSRGQEGTGIWVTVGAWQTWHWDAVWAARSSPINAVLGLDK